MHSISFESPDIGAIRFSLKKSLTALLRFFPLNFNSVYLVGVPFLTDVAVYASFQNTYSI